MVAFPPEPVYPNAIDSDYTLFLVHNTAESKLCGDNEAWADSININPASSDKPEIWPNNGFATINGELLYYDEVAKNDNDRVVMLKCCARNLGGKRTQFNPAGTWIRGLVVAEHHNQIVDAVTNTEDFIGFNFDPREETLDWRIRNLRAIPNIFDDFSCPDVNFTFITVENNPETGILARYSVEITPPGALTNFRLDFGDGQFTTTELTGEHRYALNANIDPVVTVTNDRCQIIQTPPERVSPAEPPVIVDTPFDIPIPEVPDFPDFVFVPCEVPETNINLPPLVFPCISVSPFPSLGTIPSTILLETVGDVPFIPHSVISFVGCELPSTIFVDIPSIPATIVIDNPLPSSITIVVPSSSILVQFDAENLPKMEIDWGAPPAVEVQLAMSKEIRKSRKLHAKPEMVEKFGKEYADLFDGEERVEIEYEDIGIPSEITIIPPKIDPIGFDTSNLPKSIKIEMEDLKIPENIKVFGPDVPIPDRISFDPLPTPIPDRITLLHDLPGEIEIKGLEIPKEVYVRMIEPIPEIIKIDASEIPHTIKLEGIPDHIQVLGFPDGIPLIMPENPQIEMVLKGTPAEIKIDLSDIAPAKEKGQCFQLVPCYSE